jgi:membrane-bound lytic murein transglycosylase D
MLKRKLTRTKFYGHGLLLLAAISGINMTQENDPGISVQTKSSNAVLCDTGILQLRDFDSSLFKKALTERAIEEAAMIPMNPHAVKFVNDYLKKNNEILELMKKRSDRYFKIIDPVFQKYGLPVELKYLAVIESELKSTAVSRVGAAGPWQLMPATARILGLKVNSKRDDRKHYYKSTVAAAMYLKDLYKEFGDWLLVIAAYNGGPARVYYAIRKSGSRNFWKMQKYLPAETRMHVKKFIGTHYYFEDRGSLVTLTRAEIIAHNKVIDALMSSQKQESAETQILSAVIDR